MEVAELPELAPVDRGRDDRDVLLERDHGRAGHRLSGHAVLLPRPLDEEAERVSIADDLAHRSNRLAVGLAPAHGARSEGADQLAKSEVAVDLALREVVDRPRTGRAEGGRVEPLRSG